MQDDGKMYYLQSSGAMTKGWSKIGDAWYHFATSGAMNTGWLKSGGKWYYLDPSNGTMQTGKQIVDEKPYFFKDSGALRTGWVQDGADWYYYTNGGVLKTNAWISGKYWVGVDGVMAMNAWVDGGKWYVGSNGAWVKDQPAPSVEEASAVYWTAGGEKYHKSDSCSTLDRSDIIWHGSVDDALSVGKDALCKVCGE